MKRKTATKILSVAILSSFFLPVFEWHSFEMTGPNYILSTHIPFYKYILLLMPVSALLLFVGSINDNYLFNRKMLSLVPLFTLLFISIMRFTNENSENSFYDKENSFSTLGIGFWLALFFSILLILTKGEKKTTYQYSKSQLEFFE